MNLLNNIVIIILITLFLSCDNPDPVPKIEMGDSIINNLPDQISFDIEVMFADSSHTKAILTADTARIYNDRMETLLDGSVRVEFMSRGSGKIVSILTANKARIDDKTSDMLAKGNVVVVSDSTGRKLQTSVLEWDHSTQKLFSTEFVKITAPNERIEGYGFESDQNLSNYKIFRVSGQQIQK